MKSSLLFAVAMISYSACYGQVKEDEHFLFNLMKQDSTEFRYFLDHRDSLEIQIIYTQINRDANNRPSFKTFYFNVDSTRYFYPASTVKLPMVLLALEKLNQLKIKGLDKFTPMFSDSVYSGQESVTADSTSETGLPSIAHYVKKILVTSDNDAHNRLYEFMGQKASNELMRQKGYTIRLLHRLERSLTPDENRHTEAIRFVDDGEEIYSQPMLVGDSIVVKEKILKGVAHYRKDSLIHEPFDFSYKNFFPLTDQQHLLRALLFPQTVDPKRRFDISSADRRLVMQYMSQLPGETKCPEYFADTTYFAGFVKYLMFADQHDSIPSGIRIFNKIGDAYGYLIDNAYIVDFNNKTEFMLSAVIHANTDGIYNDGDYEYETIGFPFMRNLGHLIYQYELNRKRTNKPGLNEFKFKYDRFVKP